MKVSFTKIKNHVMKEIRQLLKQVVPYIIIVTVLAGIFVFITSLKADGSSEEALKTFEKVSEQMSKNKKPNETNFDIMMRIFKNNVRVETLKLTIGSPVGFLAIPFMYEQMPLYVNSVLVAYEIYKNNCINKNKEYVSLSTFLLGGIAPHGLIEIPVIIFVYSVILMLFVNIYKLMQTINKTNIKEIFLKILKTYLNTITATMIIVIPLLAFAAFVEAYITPSIFLSIIF